MTDASLIAFGLVFLVSSWALSLALGVALRIAGGWLRALGARAERRAASVALLAPPAFSLVLVGVLALISAGALYAGTDHCVGHPHHLHVCLWHGAAWASRPWAIMLLAVAATFFAIRMGSLLWAHALAQRDAWRLRLLGEPLEGSDHGVLVPSDEPIVFTAGAWSPTVVVSRGAWEGLGPEERRAVLGHEEAHVEGGDLWRRALLGLVACFAAPLVATFALRIWERAAERICDRRAAEAVGRPSIVAGAILSLARGTARGKVPVGSVFAAESDVEARVLSLLREEPEDTRGAARLSAGLLGLGVGVVLAFVFLSEEIHHLLETILG